MNPKSIDKVDDTQQSYMDKNNIKYMICDWLPKMMNIVPHIQSFYAWWNISLLNKPTIGIVWPRKMSTYWQKILDICFKQLKQYDIVTVSGGAIWTDTYVHTMSLTYNIPTIVVLWWWIWWYRDTGKIHFLEKVIEKWWLVLSEYDIFCTPQKYTFPQRNRIIAWLSDIIFLPEAGLASGSLITVDRGIEYGKKIYAPMQDIFSEYSKGVNQYIVDWKIIPTTTIFSFLDNYFVKRISETIDTNKKTDNQKKKGISPSLTVSWSLVEQSMLELGL